MNFKLAFLCTIVVSVRGQWKTPLFDKSTGTITLCNAEFSCPTGYVCLPDPEVGGQKICFKGTDADKRITRGSCPLTPSPDVATRGTRCIFDSDCAKDKKCCNGGNNWWGGACVTPVPIPQDTTVTILVNGTDETLGKKNFKFWASIILIQSKGKNIIFETGTTGQKVQIINQLAALAGLRPKDIDFVITSHGHPDHISNGNIFTDIPDNFDNFIATNSFYDLNALAEKKPYYILGDKNLQLIFTPGHTLQDTSLVIRNVKGFGTMICSGDLVLKNGPTEESKQWAEDNKKFDESSKTVFCLADWIIPGHGTVFKVSAAQKKLWKC